MLQHILEERSKEHTPAPAGIVTFKTLTAATMGTYGCALSVYLWLNVAAQVRHSNSALSWGVTIAPEPRDIYWANLPMDDKARGTVPKDDVDHFFVPAGQSCNSEQCLHPYSVAGDFLDHSCGDCRVTLEPGCMPVCPHQASALLKASEIRNCPASPQSSKALSMCPLCCARSFKVLGSLVQVG